MKPRLEPEYGSPAWAVREILTLTRPLVTQMGDQKRSYIQSLFLLASPASASRIDPAILMALLESVETWILDPNIAQCMTLLIVIPPMPSSKFQADCPPWIIPPGDGQIQMSIHPWDTCFDTPRCPIFWL